MQGGFVAAMRAIQSPFLPLLPRRLRSEQLRHLGSPQKLENRIHRGGRAAIDQPRGRQLVKRGAEAR